MVHRYNIGGDNSFRILRFPILCFIGMVSFDSKFKIATNMQMFEL
jgi:hypothetical protein